mmetsp:Transcript_62932/g.121245  ORF Transcript_62932/g.121245 Transcript_62932/m.121245 type:complete len:227 (+) Transcript_62932:75-755(+)
MVCKITDVKVLREVAAVDEDLGFQVTMDVAEPLAEDIVFRCMFVVSPEAGSDDVELDSADIGNGPGIQAGLMRFVFEAPAPTRRQIEESGSVADTTAVYLTATYKGEEFCRIGYYVRHEYVEPLLQENPPEEVDWAMLRRVLSNPCVTRFPIEWDMPQSESKIVHSEEMIKSEAITCSTAWRQFNNDGQPLPGGSMNVSGQLRERSRSPAAKRAAVEAGIDLTNDS